MLLAIAAGIMNELVLGKIFHARVPGFVITLLGLFAFGQMMIGIELMVKRKTKGRSAGFMALSPVIENN